MSSSHTKLTETEEVLQAMFTENTGTHFLDSGGAYGRNWQRNAGRRWNTVPDATLTFRERGDGHVDMETSLSAMHWLAGRLEYDERVDDLFQAYCNRPCNKTEHYLTLMKAFPEFLTRFGFDVGGIYGEGSPFTVNTYNNEDILDQVLQYQYFTAKGPNEGDHTAFVLLQVHGGADVRGGYTQPRAFQVGGYEDRDELAITNNAKATIWCNGKPHLNATCPNGDRHLPGTDTERRCNHGSETHLWHTDDAGYHWYSDANSKNDMKNFEIKLLEDQTAWEPGTLWVIEDNVGLCPLCGGDLSLGS